MFISKASKARSTINRSRREKRRRAPHFFLGSVIVTVVATLSSAVVSPAIAMPRAADFPVDIEWDKLPFAAAWGQNAEGQLGDGTLIMRTAPVLVGADVFAGRDVSTISAGRNHMCAIADGKVYCWGSNDHGQLGVAGGDAKNPKIVPGPHASKFTTAVSAGETHTCIIADGAAYCWGDAENGKLGEGTVESAIKTSTKVGGLLANKTVTAISVGAFSTCAIADGRPYCWGNNYSGQIGTGGGFQDYAVPALVKVPPAVESQPFDSLTVGMNHACAITRGVGYCWGSNVYGELGSGTVGGYAFTPVPISMSGALANKHVVAISAGIFLTCFIAASVGGNDRRAYCFGRNNGGQTGTGLASATVPVPTALLTPGALAGQQISTISIKGQTGCVLAAGQAFCWGFNSNGQVGNLPLGGSIKEPVPVTLASSLKDRQVLTISAHNNSAAATAIKPHSFVDVLPAHPFFDNINWLAGRGITLGYEGNKFKPGQSISRPAMAAFIFRLSNPGVTMPQTCVGSVSGVSGGTPFCSAIEWLAAKEVISPNQPFRPQDSITRAVMADWLYRTVHPGMPDQPCKGNVFVDVSAAKTPSCGNIEWLAKTGITTGYDNKDYQPNNLVSRAAMAAFMHRTYHLAVSS